MEEVDYDFDYWQQHYGQENAAFGTSSVHEVSYAAPTFAHQCEEGDDIFIGRVFKNKQDCQVKLAAHALNKRFHFRHDRSCSKLTTLTCKSNLCPWRVYIVKLEDSDNYQITSANLRHTCSLEDRSQQNKLVKTKFMESLMKPKDTRGSRAVDLQKLLLDDHNAKLSYSKSHELAKETSDSDVESFALLPSYIYRLRHANPGSVMELQTDEEDKFKYLLLAFSASLTGFASMRRVIIVDGTHLRGKYEGCLLTASCQDANFMVFPMAFGIVDGENDDACEWFFRMLKKAIPDSDDLTFVSDMHSSIYTGIRRVYPKAWHGACVVHLQRKVCSLFKNPHLADLVSEAACAYRVDDFLAVFAEIRRIEPTCAIFLEELGFSNWTRSHFRGERYNIMTTNVAASLNSTLKEATKFPIILLLEFIQTTLTTWFATRREAAAKAASSSA